MPPLNCTDPPASRDEIDVIPDDGPLLKLFIERNDEAAFAKLVQFHGPMVLGVCRRVIGNQHDAEDAFQATFLVFARKARSICTDRTIAGWLYGVAYRTALKARNAAMKKRTRETPLPGNLETTAPEPEQWSALRPVLDQELNRLPETYRLPLILCYLEGKSYGEAAAQLGCPEGTLSVRLMRAKTRLAEFLRRRGLVLSVASLGTVLTCGVATAGTPAASLTASTVKAASAFAAGQTSLAGLVSNDVSSLTEIVLKTIQFPKLMALTGATIVSAGLIAVGLTGWIMSGGRGEKLSSDPVFSEVAVAPAARDARPIATTDDGPPESTANEVPPIQIPETKGTGTNPNSTPNTTDDGVAGTNWGTIKGQVTVDRWVPPLPALVKKLDPAAKDASVCSAEEVPNESMVIDPQTRGLANVVVWLTKKPATIHPDLVESKDKAVVFDQKGCRFIPHILLVRTDQRVLVLSNDAVSHNTHTYPLKNKAENFIVAPNDRKGRMVADFISEERLPIKVGCDIHPWMQAWWMILNHPYAAVTNEKGEFEISNLPVGDHEFRVWQERIGYVEKSCKVTVKAGENKLPPIVVPAATLNR